MKKRVRWQEGTPDGDASISKASEGESAYRRSGVSASGAGAQGGEGRWQETDGWGQTGWSVGNREHQAGCGFFSLGSRSHCRTLIRGVPGWRLCCTQMPLAAGVEEEGLTGKKATSWEVGAMVQV